MLIFSLFSNLTERKSFLFDDEISSLDSDEATKTDVSADVKFENYSLRQMVNITFEKKLSSNLRNTKQKETIENVTLK